MSSIFHSLLFLTLPFVETLFYAKFLFCYINVCHESGWQKHPLKLHISPWILFLFSDTSILIAITNLNCYLIINFHLVCHQNPVLNNDDTPWHHWENPQPKKKVTLAGYFSFYPMTSPNVLPRPPRANMEVVSNTTIEKWKWGKSRRFELFLSIIDE